MAYYKDPQNHVHALDSAEFEHLLPAGCVPITEAEADAMRAPSPAETAAAANAKVLEELAAIDAASIRAIREYIAAKPDAPQILKDREAAAVVARGKLA